MDKSAAGSVLASMGGSGTKSKAGNPKRFWFFVWVACALAVAREIFLAGGVGGPEAQLILIRMGTAVVFGFVTKKIV